MVKSASSPANRGAARGTTDEPSLGPLPGYLGYTLRQAQVSVFKDFAHRGAAFGITPGQFSLLILVAENPGISQGALARIHGLDKSTLSPAVDKLARRDLIRRERDPDDRRFYVLSLTENGIRTLKKVTAMVESQERAMIKAIEPSDPAAAIAMLQEIIKALGTDGDSVE
jgi:DNA-binding MarR family transcriptional regulator